jgi:hypothetical protein
MRVMDVMERATALLIPEDNIQIAAQAMVDTDSDAVMVFERAGGWGLDGTRHPGPGHRQGSRPGYDASQGNHVACRRDMQ